MNERLQAARLLQALLTVLAAAVCVDARGGESSQYDITVNQTVQTQTQAQQVLNQQFDRFVNVSDSTADPVVVWERMLSAAGTQVENIKAFNSDLRSKIETNTKLQSSLTVQVAQAERDIEAAQGKVRTLLVQKLFLKTSINASDARAAEHVAANEAITPAVEEREVTVSTLTLANQKHNNSMTMTVTALAKEEARLSALGVKAPKKNATKPNATVIAISNMTDSEKMEADIHSQETERARMQKELDDANTALKNVNDKVFPDERPVLVDQASVWGDQENATVDEAARILLTGFGQPAGMTPNEYAGTHLPHVENITQEKERLFNQYPYIAENKRNGFLDECVWELGNTSDAREFCLEVIPAKREHVTDTYEMVLEEKTEELNTTANATAGGKNHTANANANETDQEVSQPEIVVVPSSNGSSLLSNGSNGSESANATRNGSNGTKVQAKKKAKKPVSPAKAAAQARVKKIADAMAKEETVLKRLRAALHEEYRNQSMDCLSCAIRGLGKPGRNSTRAFRGLQDKLGKAGSKDEKLKLLNNIKASINQTYADEANRTRLHTLVDKAANMSTDIAVKQKSDEKQGNKTALTLVPTESKALIANLSKNSSLDSVEKDVAAVISVDFSWAQAHEAELSVAFAADLATTLRVTRSKVHVLGISPGSTVITATVKGADACNSLTVLSPADLKLTSVSQVAGKPVEVSQPLTVTERASPNDNVGPSDEQLAANDLGNKLSNASSKDTVAIINGMMGKKMPVKTEMKKLEESIIEEQQSMRQIKNDSAAATAVADNATAQMRAVISVLQDPDQNAALKPYERQKMLQSMLAHIAEVGSGNQTENASAASSVRTDSDNIGPSAKVSKLLSMLNNTGAKGKSKFQKMKEVEGGKNNAAAEAASKADSEIAGSLDKKKEDAAATASADRLNSAPKGAMVALVRKLAAQAQRPEVNVTQYAVHLLNQLNNNDTNSSSCHGRAARDLILSIGRLGAEANETHLDRLDTLLGKVSAARHDVGAIESSARNQTVENIRDIAYHLSRGETSMAVKEEVLKTSVAPTLMSSRAKGVAAVLAASLRQGQENVTKAKAELEKNNSEFAASNSDPHGEITTRETQDLKEEKLGEMAGNSLSSGALTKEATRDLVSKLTGQPVKKEKPVKKKLNATEYALALTHRLAASGNQSMEFHSTVAEANALVWNVTTGDQGFNASHGSPVNGTQRNRLLQLLHALSSGGNRTQPYETFGPGYTKPGAQRKRNDTVDSVMNVVDSNKVPEEPDKEKAVPTAGKRNSTKADDVDKLKSMRGNGTTESAMQDSDEKKAEADQNKDGLGAINSRTKVAASAAKKNETEESGHALQKAQRSNQRSASGNLNKAEEDEAAESLAENMKNGDKDHLREFMKALREGKQGMNKTNGTKTNASQADCDTKKLQQQAGGLEYEMTMLKEQIKQKEESEQANGKRSNSTRNEDREEMDKLETRKKAWVEAAAAAGSERKSWRVANTGIVSCWSVCGLQFFEDMECTKQIEGQPRESGHRGKYAAPFAFRNSICGVGGNSFKPSGDEAFWSPVCDKTQALGAEKAWLGVEFDSPRNVRCVKMAQHPHRDQQIDNVFVQSYDEKNKMWKTAFEAKDVTTTGDFVAKSVVNS